MIHPEHSPQEGGGHARRRRNTPTALKKAKLRSAGLCWTVASKLLQIDSVKRFCSRHQPVNELGVLVLGGGRPPPSHRLVGVPAPQRPVCLTALRLRLRPAARAGPTTGHRQAPWEPFAAAVLGCHATCAARRQLWILGGGRACSIARAAVAAQAARFRTMWLPARAAGARLDAGASPRLLAPAWNTSPYAARGMS